MSNAILGISVSPNGIFYLQIPTETTNIMQNVNVIQIHQHNNNNINYFQMPNSNMANMGYMTENGPIQPNAFQPNALSNLSLPIPNINMTPYNHPFIRPGHVHSHHNVCNMQNSMTVPLTNNNNNNEWTNSLSQLQSKSENRVRISNPFQSSVETTPQNQQDSNGYHGQTLSANNNAESNKNSTSMSNTMTNNTDNGSKLIKIETDTDTEKVYKCDVCDKEFKRQTNLNSHAVCHPFNHPNL